MKYLLKALRLAITRVAREEAGSGILAREKEQRLRAFLSGH
jgi:hypothetical protein